MLRQENIMSNEPPRRENARIDAHEKAQPCALAA